MQTELVYMRKLSRSITIWLLTALSSPSIASDSLPGAEDQDRSAHAEHKCLVENILISAPDTRVDDLRAHCANKVSADKLDRLTLEKLTQHNQFVITPHRQNYLLVGTYNDRPNQEPWRLQKEYPEYGKPMQHQEAKFQTSFKVPLTRDSLWFKNDGVYFGLTLKFFWQMYNKKLSAPFRDTNYRPELFYQAPLPWTYREGRFIARAGFEHESNGRSQFLSRSWNRLFVGLGYQRDNWTFYLQPWYRLPENEKVYDDDPNTPPPAKGDDNPDIEDYLGHYEFFAIYKHANYELSNMVRFNFETGKGALETGISFPLFNRLRGYVQFYNGYGESLIDYNHRVQRIGIGVLLTDLI